MVNQQLLDFIKSQLLKGVDKETITKELVSGGWTNEDIEEGFSLANAKIINLTGNYSTPIPPTIDVETYNKGKKITYTVVSSIITIAIATGLIFGDELSSAKDLLVKSIKGSKTEIVNQIKQEKNIKPEIQQKESVATQQGQEQSLSDKTEETKTQAVAPVVANKITPVVKNTVVDCGTTTIPGMSESDQKASDCMEKQFKSCSLAKENINILDSNENPFTEGPKTYYKAYSEILGYKDKLCLVKLTYITSQLPEWNNKSMTCSYDTSKSFTDNNMWNSKCSGPLYDAINN